jgi:hypothetical protein
MVHRVHLVGVELARRRRLDWRMSEVGTLQSMHVLMYHMHVEILEELEAKAMIFSTKNTEIKSTLCPRFAFPFTRR